MCPIATLPLDWRVREALIAFARFDRLRNARSAADDALDRFGLRDCTTGSPARPRARAPSRRGLSSVGEAILGGPSGHSCAPDPNRSSNAWRPA
jgi:hypothetical protein